LQICGLNTYKTHAFSPNFERTYKRSRSSDHVMHDNATSILREMPVELPQILSKRFPNGAEIISYGCSNGSEPYSIALLIINFFGEKRAEKYFEIKAKDISSKMLKAADYGVLTIEGDEKRLFGNLLKNLVFDDYFIHKKNNTYAVSEKIRNKVVFEKGDITVDAQKEFKKPVVLFFRNAWVDLKTPNKVRELALDLYNNFQPGSILVVGELEYNKNVNGSLHIMDSLQEAGFREVPNSRSKPIKYLFEKPFLNE